MQPSPMAETSRLLFPSLRFCIAFPSFAQFSARNSQGVDAIRSVMLPRHRPVFIGPSRQDDQLPVCCELINPRKILADKQVSRIRSLHVMGQRVPRFIHVVAPERRFNPGRTGWIGRRRALLLGVLQIEHAQDPRLPKPRSTHHNAKLSFSIPLGGCRSAANQLFMELWIASPFKLDL